ncbi:acyl carrier protein [Ophiocordyceps camponoti-floridani]|uniref:Acyl carrier protein n=1 Tax=Ophiocordyceps camponoti-floridani TaxID=2030778 RepID=A0A8H4QAP6_9HYPO|nr:acyl carrier protein [Ophiocordyceps camponoti-floridani]
MFRVAVVRAASAAASTAATRPVQRLALQPAVRITSPAGGRFMRRPCFGARFYSSENGLDKQQIEGRIMSLLQGFDKVNDVKNITPTAHFANDMGLDSLDAVEVVMAIEEEFSIEIPDKDADAIHSVGQAVQYIMSQPDAS